MAAPTKKTSKSRTRRRFASFVTKKRKKLAADMQLVTCSHCGAKKRNHYACMKCGHLGARHVLNTAKKDKVKKIEA